MIHRILWILLLGMILANTVFDVIVSPTGYRLVRKAAAQTRRGNPTYINPIGEGVAAGNATPIAAATARFILGAGCGLTLLPVLLVTFFLFRRRLLDLHLFLAIWVAAVSLIAKDLAWIVLFQVTDIYTAF